jgi:mannitol-specific phosphotransferase system IIBC component
MSRNTEKTLNVKIKGIAVYQIIGGIVGNIFTILAIIETNSSSKLLLSILIVSVILFSFSIYCGVKLLQGKIKSGLKLSMINQALQILSLTVLGYEFFVCVWYQFSYWH